MFIMKNRKDCELMTKQIYLTDINDVVRFVTLAAENVGSVIANSGRYYVNGKSLLGILSLNLSTPITVSIDKPFSSKFLRGIKPYVREIA